MARKPKGLHGREILLALIAERGDRCGICREPLGNLALCNVDHIVPRSRGGSGAWKNLQPAHITCNSAKSDAMPPFALPQRRPRAIPAKVMRVLNEHPPDCWCRWHQFMRHTASAP